MRMSMCICQNAHIHPGDEHAFLGRAAEAESGTGSPALLSLLGAFLNSAQGTSSLP